MPTVTGILVIILIIWIAARSLSYAMWNWKNDNKTGSVMVALVSLVSVVLPFYIIFFKT